MMLTVVNFCCSIHYSLQTDQYFWNFIRTHQHLLEVGVDVYRSMPVQFRRHFWEWLPKIYEGWFDEGPKQASHIAKWLNTKGKMLNAFHRVHLQYENPLDLAGDANGMSAAIDLILERLQATDELSQLRHGVALLNPDIEERMLAIRQYGK
jgi:hypothetical protein